MDSALHLVECKMVDTTAHRIETSMAGSTLAFEMMVLRSCNQVTDRYMTSFVINLALITFKAFGSWL